jgi:hypothetical protein
MAQLSEDQLNEIVARVTANVLREMKAHEAASLKAEIRVPLGDATEPGDEILWAPWTVAMPASTDEGEGPVGPAAP